MCLYRGWAEGSIHVQSVTQISVAPLKVGLTHRCRAFFSHQDGDDGDIGDDGELVNW